MLRLVVTALVGLQLLMPPGMCVCRFAAASPGKPQPSSQSPCCNACNARHDEADACPAVCDTQPPACVPLTPPDPLRHLAGCPAVSPEVSAKTSGVTVTPLDAAAGFHAPAALPFVCAVEPATRRPHADPHARDFTPIYLSVCSFRN